MKVLIAGSGLGGLTLAHGLLRHGIDVRVFERGATAWDRPQGYRLHLEADALNALREVLAPEDLALFDATAMVTTSFTTILSPGLDVVRQLPTHDDQDFSVWPGGADADPGHRNVDRATLRAILLRGLGGRVEFGRRVQSYASNADGVRVTFADGSTEQGDILVGADGIRSVVRTQRAPWLATMDAGVQAIYGRIPWAAAEELAPAAAREDVFAIAIDPRKVFLGLGAVDFPMDPSVASAGAGPADALPFRDDYLVCIVGGRHEHFPLPHEQLMRLPAAEVQAVALGVIDEWPDAGRRLVAAGEPGSFFSVGMRTSIPGDLDRPTNVTLLGDAVHAMTPTLGRGANLAMRDGALLARSIAAAASGASSIADALADYETGMTRYGFEVVRESVRIGEQRMAQNPLPAGV